MGWNNSRERNLLNKRIAADVEICQRDGAPQEMIAQIVEGHRNTYLSDRKEGEMTCSIEAMSGFLGSSKDDPYYMIEEWLPEKIPINDEFPWIAGFKCEELRDLLMQFDREQLKIVELIGIRKVHQTEAAEILGISQGEVSKQWKALKKKMLACLPLGVRNRFRL